MTRSARRAGDAIARAAPDLARIWRGARRQARPQVFPGLIDGIVEDFFARAGEALGDGRDPALVWPQTVGTMRVDPRAIFRSLDEIEVECDLAQEVLASAARALGAGPEATEWLARAVVIARNGARTVHAGLGPPGVVLVWAVSGLASTPPDARIDERR